MGDHLAAVWRCRHFWLSLVRMDLQTRYRRSVLGLGWSLLNPIVLTVILYTVFQPIFLAEVPDYALFVLAGLVYWNYFTSVTIHGCNCFFLAEAYIRQYPSPLAIFPLRAALSGLIHFLLALAVVLTATGLTRGFAQPLALLSLVPSLVLLFILSWATALLAGVANVLFRDTEHLAQVLFQVLFYLTPIIYPARMLHNYRLGWLADLNPLVVFLELLRAPILDGTWPAPATFALASGFVGAVAVAAVAVLHRMQRQLIFYL